MKILVDADESKMTQAQKEALEKTLSALKNIHTSLIVYGEVFGKVTNDAIISSGTIFAREGVGKDEPEA